MTDSRTLTRDAPRAAGGRRPWVLAAVMLVVVGITAWAVRPSGHDAQTPPHNGVAPTPSERAGDGHWRPLAQAPLVPRSGHVTVWTGSCAGGRAGAGCDEMLVWGGVDDVEARSLADGAAYAPAEDTWRRLPEPPIALADMVGARAVWAPPLDDARVPPGAWPAGALLLWPVIAEDGEADGLLYDPELDAWQVLPRPPIGARYGHALGWTGRELLIWGGFAARSGAALASGVAFDPVAARWRVLPASPLAAGWATTQVEDGGATLIYAVPDSPRSAGRLARYRAQDDAWEPLPALPGGLVATAGGPSLLAVESRVIITAAPTGAPDALVLAVLEAGGSDWTLVALPDALRGATTLVAGPGSSVFVWRRAPNVPEPGLPDGALVDLETGTASVLPAGPAPLIGQSVVWTGRELLVWGGTQGSALQASAEGSAYVPPHSPEGQ